jgi:hypothetical protein
MRCNTTYSTVFDYTQVQHGSAQCVVCSPQRIDLIAWVLHQVTHSVTLSLRYNRNVKIISHDMNSNELKAAKRRIYRQRQKTEDQRQILRYVCTNFSWDSSACIVQYCTESVRDNMWCSWCVHYDVYSFQALLVYTAKLWLLHIAILRKIN